ncbi:GIY-YIG nuclease family protein [Clostridium novyi]|nr:GIY-YIG nuclease family protein [Clostridium novyi]
MIENIIGIYRIMNLANNKKYIGQSIDIINRWQSHKSALYWNNHPNKELQQEWNQYGYKYFEFTLLEKCKAEDLNNREKYYIRNSNSYLNGYNETEGGDTSRINNDNYLEEYTMNKYFEFDSKILTKEQIKIADNEIKMLSERKKSRILKDIYKYSIEELSKKYKINSNTINAIEEKFRREIRRKINML